VAHIIEVQYALDCAGLPGEEQLILWANTALQDIDIVSELSIRIVGEAESAGLNKKWRNKLGPTNVLSFPADMAEEVQPRPLGDLVVCAPVVIREAIEQGKLINAHWAHILIHGTLHLLGYDHIEEPQAQLMEALEIDILNKLEIDNPYI